jgi:hypothetical protein
VYRKWFDTVADLLPIGGRHCMQTVTCGRRIIPPETWDINASYLIVSGLCLSG